MRVAVVPAPKPPKPGRSTSPASGRRTAELDPAVMTAAVLDVTPSMPRGRRRSPGAGPAPPRTPRAPRRRSGRRWGRRRPPAARRRVEPHGAAAAGLERDPPGVAAQQGTAAEGARSGGGQSGKSWATFSRSRQRVSAGVVRLTPVVATPLCNCDQLGASPRETLKEGPQDRESMVAGPRSSSPAIPRSPRRRNHKLRAVVTIRSPTTFVDAYPDVDRDVASSTHRTRQAPF